LLAARVVARGQVEVDDFDAPVLGETGVLVRTLLAAVCGSDLHNIFGDLRDQPFPWLPGQPGHEGVGEVVESRSASVEPGELVLTVPEPYHAATFAEFQVLTEDSLVRLSTGTDPKKLLMAQQLGTVIFALKRMWPGSPAEAAAVIGAGPAGLSFIQLLKRRGFPMVVAADLSADRLRRARELGADHTVLATESSVVDAVFDLTGGLGADLVVEAAGHDITRAEAMTAVREGGRIGLYGLPERSSDAAYPYHVLFRRQPTIEVVYGAQTEPGLASFREAVRMIEAGHIADIISHTYGIDEIGDALSVAHDRRDGAIKVCLSVAGVR
jgi:L-iditol 2-dehydrogenase